MIPCADTLDGVLHTPYCGVRAQQLTFCREHVLDLHLKILDHSKSVSSAQLRFASPSLDGVQDAPPDFNAVTRPFSSLGSKVHHHHLVFVE